MNEVNRILSETFLEMAQMLETGRSGRLPKVAVTGVGSEHGEQNVMQAAEAAARKGVEVFYIGTLTSPLVTTVSASTDEEAHKAMEELLGSGKAEAAVTMHYPFPIGVSTVGRAITPAAGKEMFIANTTGTSSADRVEGMVLNAISGIITAKACGIADPRVGILNVDGARQTEIVLNKLRENGYAFSWAESKRSDGGAVLRGNDVLTGTPDVLVTDSLTGNVLIKMLAAFTSGGSFETTGYGYGPGIGRGYNRLVLIISRASGAPLITNAILYAAELIRNGVAAIAAEEYAKADKAGLGKLLEARRTSEKKPSAPAREVKKEPCTFSVAGIDVTDIEDAAAVLLNAGIYAQTGMGCTGPLVMLPERHKEEAVRLLKEAGYIG